MKDLLLIGDRGPPTVGQPPVAPPFYRKARERECSIKNPGSLLVFRAGRVVSTASGA